MEASFGGNREIVGKQVELSGHSLIYSLWKRTFGGNPKTVGKQVELSGHSFTIIGVAPKSFTGVDLWFRPDVYLPMMMTAAVAPEGSDTLTHRDYRGCNLLGRLKPGVTIAQAQAELNVIMSDLERQYPATTRIRLQLFGTR